MICSVVLIHLTGYQLQARLSPEPFSSQFRLASDSSQSLSTPLPHLAFCRSSLRLIRVVIPISASRHFVVDHGELVVQLVTAGEAWGAD